MTDKPKTVANVIKGVKSNIKSVKIDFPLPSEVKGIEKRLNSKNIFAIPK
jgi:hypothetical protein